MLENKTINDNYTLGVDYTIKHVSSDLLQMSCYGWHFTDWTDENGDRLSADQICIFEVLDKSLSANWERNTYWASFFNDYGEQIPLSSLSALYLSSVEDSGTIPTPYKEGFRSKGWIGGDYTRISADLSVVPDWIAQCYISWVRQSQPKHPVRSLTCDEGESVQYPPLSDFQRSLHTVSSWSDTSLSIARQGSHTISALEQENRLNVEITHVPEIVTYGDDNYYSISVTNVTKNPYYDTPVNIWYSENGGEWRSKPYVYHELTSVTVDISVDADNYFSERLSRPLSIIDGEIYHVTFNYLKEDDSMSSVIRSAPKDRDIPIEQVPVPPSKTLRKVYVGWDDISKISNLTADQTVNATYDDRYYTVNYYWDEVSGYQHITETSALYKGNAFHPYPSLEEYVCGGWGRNKTGRLSSERDICDNSILSSIETDNISVYAFMRKIHPVKAYMVYGNNVVLSTLEGEVSTIIDYEYLSSDQIGLSDIRNYEFDRWYPEFDITGTGKNGSWRIDRDDYSISAIYKAKIGTLRYHSNYPQS